jgi:hypothetical protein
MFLIGAVLAAALSSHADPLGPAHAGKLQCYSPDPAHKLCRALSGYEFEKGGTINNRASVLVAPKPAIAMTTVTPVVIRDGAVCGPIRQEDINSATFTIDSKAATPDQTQMLRGKMITALTQQFGKEICTTYTKDGAQYKATATVDGVPHPEATDHVIWVAPKDGYSVGH